MAAAESVPEEVAGLVVVAAALSAGPLAEAAEAEAAECVVAEAAVVPVAAVGAAVAAVVEVAAAAAAGGRPNRNWGKTGSHGFPSASPLSLEPYSESFFSRAAITRCD